MNKSVETSSQFKLLPPHIQALIDQDMMRNPDSQDGAAPFSFAMEKRDSIPAATQGTVFKDDAPAYGGTVGPLTRADLKPADRQVPDPRSAAPAAPAPGALSQVSDSLAGYKMPTIDEVMNRYIPQDSSSDRYLAMAAGLGRPTGFGSFGEKMANVADAVQTQKLEQQKLRMQYLPAIMQQVASQQQMMYEMQGAVNAGTNLGAANTGYGAAPQGQAGPMPTAAPQQAGQPQSPDPTAQPPMQPQGGSQPWNPAEHGGLLKPIPQAELDLIKTLPFKDRAKAYQEIAQRYTTPAYQSVNGSLVNTNDGNFQPGVQPGVQVSANGSAVGIGRGQDGRVSVYNPQGAIAAQLAQQGGDMKPVKLGNQEVSMTPAEINDYATKGIVPMRYARLVQGGQSAAPVGGAGAPPAGGPQGAPGQGGEAPTLGASASPAEMARQSAEKAAADASARGQVDNGIKYEGTLLDTHRENESMMLRNQQILPLLDRVQTGKFAQGDMAQLGVYLQNSGWAPDAIKTWVNKAAGGDTAAVKTIENQLAAAGITTMLTTLAKEGSPNRAMFQAVHEAQESLKSGNPVLKDVIELQRRMYQNTLDEVQGLHEAKQSGSYNPALWSTGYALKRAEKFKQPVAPLPSAQVPHYNINGDRIN